MRTCAAHDGATEIQQAVDSLREELDAIKKYSQRISVCGSPELKAVLQHNLREEREHAAKLLTWLRNSI